MALRAALPIRALEPARALKYLRVRALGRGGFTLIEIIVALCIVAILTIIAIPGFKKATEDFRLNSTVEDTLDIIKACRNYYLIFNEFPPNMGDDIPDKLLPFVPKHLIDPNRGTGGQVRRWNHRPLGKTAYNYDLDNFMDLSQYKPHGMGISLYGLKQNTADWNKLYNKFKSIIGERYITLGPESNRMFCLLPECPGSADLNGNATWENRYY
jgi:prepilin-type N-terminal cleavage/methylation domain-containing protein